MGRSFCEYIGNIHDRSNDQAQEKSDSEDQEKGLRNDVVHSITKEKRDLNIKGSKKGNLSPVFLKRMKSGSGIPDRNILG